jgi:hypothetical protein
MNVYNAIDYFVLKHRAREPTAESSARSVVTEVTLGHISSVALAHKAKIVIKYSLVHIQTSAEFCFTGDIGGERAYGRDVFWYSGRVTCRDGTVHAKLVHLDTKRRIVTAESTRAAADAVTSVNYCCQQSVGVDLWHVV